MDLAFEPETYEMAMQYFTTLWLALSMTTELGAASFGYDEHLGPLRCNINFTV